MNYIYIILAAHTFVEILPASRSYVVPVYLIYFIILQLQ